MIVVFSGLLAAAGLNVVTAAPAGAIPGLNNVAVATVLDSSVFKSATALCPAGQRVIGGGARLNIATAEVSITRMAPNATATGYEAFAYEDFDGFAGVWAMQVIAICAPPPAGYVVVTAASPMASPATATVAAVCPAGLQVLGTGGAVFPGRGVVVLTAIMPNTMVFPTGIIVSGAEVQGGFTGTWNVQSWAICAAPVPGHIVVSTTTATDSVSPKSVAASCPAGRNVHGVGFQFGGMGAGEIFLNMAFPNPPVPLATMVPVTASEDQSGFAGNWNARSFAICAL